MSMDACRDQDSPRFDALFGDACPNLLSKFFAYHAKNPAVYAAFLTFARQARASGRKRFSVWMIANRVRWYTAVETTGPQFKLTNDYFALYARLLTFLHPEFDGFFEMRAMKKVRVGPWE